MAFGGQEQAAIIGLMTVKYQDLLVIESEWGIRLKEGDLRPRIEHFHDAVRALTSGSANPDEKHSRLSVEHLAYDLGQLRTIADRPLGIIHRATAQSASTQLVTPGANTSYVKMAPQAVRGDIIRLYRDYTVFFAALFAEVADRNYQSRSDAIDGSVSDIGLIEQILDQLLAGRLTNAQAMQELMHVERDDLREKLQAMLASQGVSTEEKRKARAVLGKIEQGLAKEKKALDQSHMHYATGQLAVYEQAKETLKQLAGAGLNLAGRFVENAMRAAQQGRGQGR